MGVEGCAAVSLLLGRYSSWRALSIWPLAEHRGLGPAPSPALRADPCSVFSHASYSRGLGSRDLRAEPPGILGPTWSKGSGTSRREWSEPRKAGSNGAARPPMGRPPEVASGPVGARRGGRLGLDLLPMQVSGHIAQGAAQAPHLSRQPALTSPPRGVACLAQQLQLAIARAYHGRSGSSSGSPSPPPLAPQSQSGPQPP